MSQHVDFLRRSKLADLLQPSLEAQRAARLRELDEEARRLGAYGWTLLRRFSLSWQRGDDFVPTTPGFEVMEKVARHIFERFGGPLNLTSTIDIVALSPTDEQQDAFKLAIGGRWGGLERRVYPSDIIDAWEAM